MAMVFIGLLYVILEEKAISEDLVQEMSLFLREVKISEDLVPIQRWWGICIQKNEGMRG